MRSMLSGPRALPTGAPPDSLAARYGTVRSVTRQLIDPLSPEDCVVQSMPDASPAKWHLAHTSWFFEQFVLQAHLPGYRVFEPRYSYLFNSYYESVGPRHRRPHRGLLTRPSLEEVLRYRDHVDEQMSQLLTRDGEEFASNLIELGLEHEQQHQELLLMDVKHLLWCSPLLPAYKTQVRRAAPATAPVPPATFVPHPSGIYEIGHSGGGFCFDNEMPRHRVYLEAFELANGLITNADYLQFIRDQGYAKAEIWLSDGWQTVQQCGWNRPLYWAESLDAHFTLHGMAELDLQAPVCHVSYYEADAFARWAGARLATEAEWEVAAHAQLQTRPIEGNFLECGLLRPAAPGAGLSSPPQSSSDMQMFGDVWQWTSSAYAPYPGFRALAGGLGEYNGKFMANQFVLRGGCCVTPRTHIRASYRNFFYPHMRWQFSGIRLAKGEQG